MRMIAPRTGHEEFTVAEDQVEYRPIVVNRFLHENGSVTILARFQPTPEERQRIAAGEDIYIGQLNFGTPMTPIMVDCGRPDWVPVVKEGGE